MQVQDVAAVTRDFPLRTEFFVSFVD